MVMNFFRSRPTLLFSVSLVIAAVVLSMRSADMDMSNAAGNDYELVWSDEFDIDGRPDTTKWHYEKGFVRNHELQWYQPENAWCEGGKLIIEARKEQRPNPNFEEGSRDWKKNRSTIDYTSSCLLTRKTASWQYGRFEMRGRIDVRSGLWPAWWTLGVSRRWPGNGEIDIMEFYRGQLLANIACLNRDGYSAKWYGKRFKTDSMGGKAWADQFHVWRMDWSDQEISLFLDDRLLNRVPVDSLYNRDGSGFNPFRQAHFMLLNLAVGGDNGGDPTRTSFPNRFEVDYVRVYQRKAGR
jgi:beta-glucanase (GH16 family)